MSLNELAAIGNFISGVAVFISFVFLALQLRQANRNQHSLMQHGRNARTREIFMHFADPSVTALVIRAFEADPALSDADYFAFYSLAGAIFMNYEDSFRQFRAGTLDYESWDSDRRTLQWLLAAPAYRAAWKALRDSIGDDYRDFVDSLMQNTQVQPLRHHADLMRQYITEETVHAAGGIGGKGWLTFSVHYRGGNRKDASPMSAFLLFWVFVAANFLNPASVIGGIAVGAVWATGKIKFAFGALGAATTVMAALAYWHDPQGEFGDAAYFVGAEFLAMCAWIMFIVALVFTARETIFRKPVYLRG